jgi:hypothetical protein
MSGEFIEDRALHAALSQDQNELDVALKELLDGELRELHNAAHDLAAACEAEIDERRKRRPQAPEVGR